MAKRERRRANAGRKQANRQQRYESREVAKERLNHSEEVGVPSEHHSNGRGELVNYILGDCRNVVVDKFIPGEENTAKLTLVESLMQSIANGETEEVIPIKELSDIDHREIDLINGGEN